MKIMIELKNISKTFKNELIFNDISLEFFDNTIYGIIGRNGSGKSVLFKMISGYMKPDVGNIIVEGKNINKNGIFPDSIGILIESPGFLWFESALSNLKYLADIKNNVSEQQIIDTIKAVGIDPYSKKKTGKFSLGMKQRLGIAQAIMESPDILILDEPFNGLDDEGVNHIRKLILGYKQNGRTIIISSHNKEDIDLLCDIVYRIENGKIVEL